MDNLINFLIIFYLFRECGFGRYSGQYNITSPKNQFPATDKNIEHIYKYIYIIYAYCTCIKI